MSSPIVALGRGIAAGVAGTAAMTAAQTAYYKATGTEPSTTPAEVAKRIIGGVLKREVPEDRDELLTSAMHWTYGTGWGALLGLAAAGRRPGTGSCSASPSGARASCTSRRWGSPRRRGSLT